MEAVDPPKAAPFQASTIAWEDVPKLFAQVSDLLYRIIFLLALQTGLRHSELSGLQWKDVDFEKNTLAVQRARVKLPSGSVRMSEPKSGLGRPVDLPPQSVDALRDHLERQKELSGNGNFVFCHSDGTPLDPNQITKKFKQAAKAAGFANLRLHDLRHTHASLLLKGGTHLKVTSERLGHSTIAITANLYSHVLPTVQEEAAQRFGDAWSVMEERDAIENGKKNGKTEIK